jgi:hypothetical protein
MFEWFESYMPKPHRKHWKIKSEYTKTYPSASKNLITTKE